MLTKKTKKNLSKIGETLGRETQICSYSIAGGADPITTTILHGHRIYKSIRKPVKALITTFKMGVINPLNGRSY